MQPGLPSTGAHITTIADNKPGAASNGRPDGFWHRVGDAAGSAAAHVGKAAADTVDAGRDAIDGVANLGEYVLRNPTESLDLPGDGAWMTVGSLGMALGVAGEAGGLVLSASGIGAPLGIPAAAVSASVAAAGATAAVHGAREFSQNLTRMNAEAQDAAAKGEAGGPSSARNNPLESSTAQAINAALPGRVQGVGRLVKRPDGTDLTDYDVVGDNFVVEVTGGAGKGKTWQVGVIAASTDKRVAVYAPNMRGASVRGIEASGVPVFRDVTELIDWVRRSPG